MILNGKRIDLPQLEAELTAAGVTHRRLGTVGDDLHTYTATGGYQDLPAGAGAVIAAHVPPPIPAAPDYGADLQTPAEFASQAAVAVTNLRAYINAPAPTAGQTTAVVKLLCRIALVLIRRAL